MDQFFGDLRIPVAPDLGNEGRIPEIGGLVGRARMRSVAAEEAARGLEVLAENSEKIMVGLLPTLVRTRMYGQIGGSDFDTFVGAVDLGP